MLDTLLKIGKWQSEGQSEWVRFLEKPNINEEDRNGNPITNYILPIIFDLDEKQVIIDKCNLKIYNENLLEPLKALKIRGGAYKAIYTTVPTNKLIQLYKTFFGKENEQTKTGELTSAIRKENIKLSESFILILSDIFALKDKFVEFISFFGKNTIKEINAGLIEQKLNVNPAEHIVLLYVQIKGKKYGYEKPISFAELEDYVVFLKKIFLASEETNIIRDKLCYASGIVKSDVTDLNLPERFSLNKMFVTETKNYASHFDENHFSFNYQVSKENQKKLDIASEYLLNKYQITIANINHVMIPQFREGEDLDFETALLKNKKKSEILFNLVDLNNLIINIEDETDDIFWINFIAYESNGNFFKSTEIIKDVSTFHIQKVINALQYIDWKFKKYEFVDWNSVMTDFGKSGCFLNLNTVFGLIPIRKDKEKKNKALILFKAILENRMVEKQKLFEYFCELILCHYYERYNSYTNIKKSSKDYFGKTIRDSVFKYLAFIQVLKKLNLINMEESTQIKETTENKYDKAIFDFFNEMKFNQDQKAMFYLGRMLNAVEFMQKEKKKTVINKVNFNGMDKDDIQRLRISLYEKAKQYGKIGKIIFTDKNFADLFDYNNWRLNPQEAVFFLLTGYSFGISKKEAEEIETNENEE